MFTRSCLRPVSFLLRFTLRIQVCVLNDPFPKFFWMEFHFYPFFWSFLFFWGPRVLLFTQYVSPRCGAVHNFR